MAGIFNTEFVDLLIAPGLSEFTSFEAPDLMNSHPQSPHWIANHFLSTLFGDRFKDKYRQWVFNQLFRAEVVFRDYHEARLITLEVIEKSDPGRPAIRTYFKAVARWESCLLNIQIFIDLMNKMKRDLGDSPVFSENDDSVEERTYSMANRVKHWGGDVAAGRHEQHHTIPVWLSNDGLMSRTHQLNYFDLAEMVNKIACAANELQNPKRFCLPLQSVGSSLDITF